MQLWRRTVRNERRHLLPLLLYSPTNHDSGIIYPVICNIPSVVISRARPASEHKLQIHFAVRHLPYEPVAITLRCSPESGYSPYSFPSRAGFSGFSARGFSFVVGCEHAGMLHPSLAPHCMSRCAERPETSQK